MVANPLFATWRLARRVQALVDEAVGAETDLDASEFALYSLLAFEDAVTPSSIAQSTGTPPSTVTQQLRRIAARGHLARRANPHDARSYLVSLNEAGRAEHARAVPRFAALLERVRAVLREDEEAVMAALARFEDALATVAEDERRTVAPPAPTDGVAMPLSAAQRDEVAAFEAWVRWRDGALAAAR